MPTRKKFVHAEHTKKAPSAVHEAFAAFILATTGVEILPSNVALVQRLYPHYLKTPAVAAAREAEKAEREAEKAERESAKRERLQERLARIEAQRQKVLADLGLDGTAPEALVPDSERFTDNGLVLVEDAPEDEDPEEDEEPIEPVVLESEDGWEVPADDEEDY